MLNFTSRMSLSYCPTSYSWEKRRASLALSRSMWSANSQTDMGGCSLIPKIESKTTRSDEHISEYHTWCIVPLRQGASLSVLSWGGHNIEILFAPWCDNPSARFVVTYIVSSYVYTPKTLWICYLGGQLAAKNHFPATVSACDRIKATCSAGSEEMLSLRDVRWGKEGGL